ncbi:MAG: dockerin type I repeat-containing protein [Clostridia bacterium]|nr:dockerin type I repeat-containing protein [Clostridia bacterium]
MKKILSLLLAAVTACTCLIFSPITADASTIKGDVNGDNQITLRDATLAQKINAGLISPTSNQKSSADFNSNGSVELVDAYTIQKFVCLDISTIKTYAPNRSQRIAFIDAVNTERAAQGYSPLVYNEAMLTAGNLGADLYMQTGTVGDVDDLIDQCNLGDEACFSMQTTYTGTITTGAKLFTWFKNQSSSGSSTYDDLISPYSETVSVGFVNGTSNSTAYWVIFIN